MEFTFDQKPTVRIQGKDYEFDPTNNDLILGVVNAFPEIVKDGQEMQKAINLIKNQKEDSRQKLIAANEKLMKDCREFIIGCLGEKEYNEIFAQRRPNSTEHLNLCAFLYESLFEGREKLLEDYLGDDAEDAVDETSEDGSWEGSADGLPNMDAVRECMGSSTTTERENLSQLPPDLPAERTIQFYPD